MATNIILHNGVVIEAEDHKKLDKLVSLTQDLPDEVMWSINSIRMVGSDVIVELSPFMNEITLYGDMQKIAFEDNVMEVLTMVSGQRWSWWLGKRYPAQELRVKSMSSIPVDVTRKPR